MLDVQWLRQVYRAFGWPHRFLRVECFRYIEKLMDEGWEA